MNKEELLQKYAVKYKEYLNGECSWHDVYQVFEQIEGIEGIYEEAAKLREEIYTNYLREIIYPLSDDLLEFLQFEGLVQGPEYKKRAKELSKKLRKYDSQFAARKRALNDFFKHTKIGSHYDEDRKLALALRLGALDFEE